MLERALASHESYKDVVELEGGNDTLSAYQIYMIQMKRYYLCTELSIAKEKIHTTTWVACCPEEIKVLSHIGIKYVKRFRTMVD